MVATTHLKNLGHCCIHLAPSFGVNIIYRQKSATIVFAERLLEEQSFHPERIPPVQHTKPKETDGGQRTELPMILLMVRKSGVHHLRLAVYPMIYTGFIHPIGAGFLPPTVCVREVISK